MSYLQTNRVIYFLFIFLFCFLVFVFRRPEIITNAQFWAEDGAIWYHQANTIGPLNSLILPQQGYYQTISKLVASLSLAVPVYYAPLLYNVIGISIRCFMVMFLLSNRLSMYSLPSRVLIALFVVLMPHLEEVHANITNTHWYLSMWLFMVLIANKPASRIDKTHDIFVLVIAGLSGPFIVFMAPVLALKMIANASGKNIFIKTINAIKSVDWFAFVFIALCVVQLLTIAMSFNESRNHTELGATFQLFINILSTRVFAGFALSDSGIQMLWTMDKANDVIVIISCCLLVLALYKAKWRAWAIVIYPFTMLFLALAKPMISQTIPQWHGFEFTAAGQRYFVITSIFWFAIILLAFSRLGNAMKYVGYACAAMVLIKVAVYDFRIEPLPDAGWSEQVEKYNSSAKGEPVRMSINPPGWVMEVIK
ncbi:Uncharacterised protein [Enterobacter hormaechei]|uniref:hypothetical protein n=1 Tax=Enterobacter hormaechei TaxID=158836 RepID=UPI001259D8E0|nr:hypothetical protein [Enterobacter hormaechei]EMB6148268.1 hypothetical protein [Enterobacter asburiae]VAE39250.1 Uncharacterised protein [Enterobacter hormaechei]VAM23472.1 Uncharacterised protein [Enterobacter hormaechei]